VLVAVESQIALGLLVTVTDDAVGGGELGHHQPASAEIADEAAENGVGNAGHGREDGGGTDFDVAERERGGDAGVRGSDALGRIVEKLGHELILAGLAKNNIHHGGTEDTEKDWAKIKGEYNHGFTRMNTDQFRRKNRCNRGLRG